MLFCSRDFLFFFLTVLAIYWALPWTRARLTLLLAASFYFYACWNKWLALLIAATSTFDYAVGLALDRSGMNQRRRAYLLGLSLTINLGLLAYFKYANFFLDSLEQLLRSLGASTQLPTLRVILPIGISFYTFEAINYTVDVYKRRVPAERDLTRFLLFITFFPHLVAGPIVRARDFLPQLRQAKRWNWSRMQVGVQYFLLGLVKKLAVADRMAAYSDPVFANPEAYGTLAVWVAVIAYALQIYCDFSGYTDMAIGCAHMLGYKLSPNFNLPYLARNVSEFWRRWHISLSTWLRDYLFIPLGGSRGTRTRTALNLMITMTLGGLWHGASWNFVLWGLFHGALLVAHRGFREFSETRAGLRQWLAGQLGTALSILTTFGSVCVGWIFFRATTLADALTLLERLVIPHAGAAPPALLAAFGVTFLAVMACHFLVEYASVARILDRIPTPLVGFGYATLLITALALAPSTETPFVYFQF